MNLLGSSMANSSAVAPRSPAAEVTKRVCCGLELDPKYADVVVERWQGLSGKQGLTRSELKE
jgi:DNA modification methylase